MKVYLNFITKTIVLINLLLLLPAIYGLIVSIVFTEQDLHNTLSKVLFIDVSFLIGITNGLFLFFHRYEPRAWWYNLIVSVYALLLWSIVAIKNPIDLRSSAILACLYPILMIWISYRILRNYHRYENARK